LSSAVRQPIVILISGRGSNMQALIERSRAGGASFRVAQVFSDRADAPGLEWARNAGIPARAIPCAKGVDRLEYDGVLAAAVEACSPAMIALAGFMRILSAPFVAQFAGRMLNIHPSLLPKHKGLHTHRRAIEARDAEHGATVHFVDEELDGGAPIIQAKVAVAADDTEATLSQRVLMQEHRIYPLAVNWFCEGRLRYQAGRAWLDDRCLTEPVQLGDIEPELRKESQRQRESRQESRK
jgi:phosphoribosylglycinamide formyltransferase-1